jgi:hypothetical protein
MTKTYTVCDWLLAVALVLTGFMLHQLVLAGYPVNEIVQFSAIPTQQNTPMRCSSVCLNRSNRRSIFRLLPDRDIPNSREGGATRGDAMFLKTSPIRLS